MVLSMLTGITVKKELPLVIQVFIVLGEKEKKMRLINVDELPITPITTKAGVIRPFILLRDIMDAPIIEVVRCKDCIYGELDDNDFPNQYLCHFYGDIWEDGDHFCSRGQKKENET